jgi:hypothetical protein
LQLLSNKTITDFITALLNNQTAYAFTIAAYYASGQPLLSWLQLLNNQTTTAFIIAAPEQPDSQCLHPLKLLRERTTTAFGNADPKQPDNQHLVVTAPTRLSSHCP